MLLPQPIPAHAVPRTALRRGGKAQGSIQLHTGCPSSGRAEQGARLHWAQLQFQPALKKQEFALGVSQEKIESACFHPAGAAAPL